MEQMELPKSLLHVPRLLGIDHNHGYPQLPNLNSSSFTSTDVLQVRFLANFCDIDPCLGFGSESLTQPDLSKGKRREFWVKWKLESHQYSFTLLLSSPPISTNRRFFFKPGRGSSSTTRFVPSARSIPSHLVTSCFETSPSGCQIHLR